MNRDVSSGKNQTAAVGLRCITPVVRCGLNVSLGGSSNKNLVPVVTGSSRSIILRSHEGRYLRTLFSFLESELLSKEQDWPWIFLTSCFIFRLPFTVIVVIWRETGEAGPSTMYLTKATCGKKSRLLPGWPGSRKEKLFKWAGFHLPLDSITALWLWDRLPTFRMGLSTNPFWKHPYRKFQRFALLS